MSFEKPDDGDHLRNIGALLVLTWQEFRDAPAWDGEFSEDKERRQKKLLEALAISSLDEAGVKSLNDLIKTVMTANFKEGEEMIRNFELNILLGRDSKLPEEAALLSLGNYEESYNDFLGWIRDNTPFLQLRCFDELVTEVRVSVRNLN